MALLAAMALFQAATAAPAATPASLAGEYDGSQMEMAAELVLQPDGRFEYGLSYGALDEVSSGRWIASADAVMLSSDPVTPPAYSFEDKGAEHPGTVTAKLEAQQGLNPQYFSFVLTGDGIAPIEADVGPDGEAVLAYDPASPPNAIRVLLPIYELVSQPFPLDLAKDGRRVVVRFTPNDLGRVMFEDALLPITEDGLHMERFGRTIIFRKRR